MMRGDMVFTKVSLLGILIDGFQNLFKHSKLISENFKNKKRQLNFLKKSLLKKFLNKNMVNAA